MTVFGLVAGSPNATVLVYYCTDRLLNELEAVLNSEKNPKSQKEEDMNLINVDV